MLVVILAYDQLIFRPLIVWGDRFRIDQEQGGQVPDSWALTMMQRSRLIVTVTALFNSLVRRFNRQARPITASATHTLTHAARRTDMLWFALLVLLVALAGWRIAHSLIGETTAHEALQVASLACLTLVRVVVLIALASLVWVPIGVWVGLRPRTAALVQPVAQFLAAFPSNLLFPVVVVGIVAFRLNPDLWLSPLMILGRRRLGDADGAALCEPESGAARQSLVAQGGAAGRAALLRHGLRSPPRAAHGTPRWSRKWSAGATRG